MVAGWCSIGICERVYVVVDCLTTTAPTAAANPRRVAMDWELENGRSPVAVPWRRCWDGP